MASLSLTDIEKIIIAMEPHQLRNTFKKRKSIQSQYELLHGGYTNIFQGYLKKDNQKYDIHIHNNSNGEVKWINLCLTINAYKKLDTGLKIAIKPIYHNHISSNLS